MTLCLLTAPVAMTVVVVDMIVIVIVVGMMVVPDICHHIQRCNFLCAQEDRQLLTGLRQLLIKLQVLYVRVTP